MKPQATRARTRGRHAAAAARKAVDGKSRSRGPVCGYHQTTQRMATLADVLDPNVPTNSLGDLDHSQLVNLVVARLKADKHFLPLFMLGAKGVVDKERAIREVRKGTPIGLHLIEIEKEYIRLQVARGE